MITLDSIPMPNTEVVGRFVKEEAVLVLPGQGKVKVLNEVGASIWRLCDGALSARQIAAEICREYEVDALEAEADTLAFLTELEARGIVQAKEVPGQ